MILKQKTFSAVRWTTFAAVGKSLLQLGQVVVLARLLAPSDYGLMAMVSVVLSFAGIFADLGLSSAYVQRQNVTDEQRSSLFWLNATMGMGLTLLVMATSPVLSWAFGDPRLTPLLMLSASSFLIGSLGQQVRVNAEKALEFRAVVLLEIAASLFAFLVAVTCALSGLGVYSLVASGIVGTLASTVLAWLLLSQGWRPKFRMRIDDIRPFIKFGGAMVADAFLNHINRSVDLILGGRFLAATQLGLYSVPRNLIFQIQAMVNPIITRVGFPLIAKVQHDATQVRKIYLKSVNMTASTNAPLYLGLAFFAPDVVQVLLGKNWASSVDFLRVLAVWGFLRSTGNTVGSLLAGTGRADLGMKWNFGLLFIIPPALWAGASFGALGVAWALLGVGVVMFVPAWYILVRPTCQCGLAEYSVAALRSFVISGLAFGAVYFMLSGLEGAIPRILAAVPLVGSLYLGLSYKLNREWFFSMRELVGIKPLSAEALVHK